MKKQFQLISIESGRYLGSVFAERTLSDGSSVVFLIGDNTIATVWLDRVQVRERGAK